MKWQVESSTVLVTTIDPRDHEEMKAYSEDFSQKIVAVVEHGMPKTRQPISSA
jgi:hypothetical protein